MILHNGPVYTMDPRLPQVRALSVAGDTIAGGVDVREGGTDAVGHERIDLEGRCVLPAFCDATSTSSTGPSPAPSSTCTRDVDGGALRIVGDAGGEGGCAGTGGSRPAGPTGRRPRRRSTR